jgi:hypothetical protein
MIKKIIVSFTLLLSLVSFAQEGTSSPYSFYGIGTNIPEASGDSSDPMPYFIQICYYILGFGMPLFLGLLLLITWTLPLSYIQQQTAYIAMEVMYAWAAVDVFCLSIFALSLEISQFAQFIVGDSCDQINKLLALFLDDKLEGDNVCFDLIATIVWDSWLIFASAFALFLLVFFFEKVLRSALQDKGMRLRSTSHLENTAPNRVELDVHSNLDFLYTPLLNESQLGSEAQESHRASSVCVKQESHYHNVMTSIWAWVLMLCLQLRIVDIISPASDLK